MSSFEHKELIQRIVQLDQVPEAADAYTDWIEAGGHLTFLRENARADELALYASGEYTFIHAAVVSEGSLSSLTQDDLLTDGASCRRPGRHSILPGLTPRKAGGDRADRRLYHCRVL